MSNANASAATTYMLTFAAPVLSAAMVDAQDRDVTADDASRVCRELGAGAHLTNHRGYHVADVGSNGALRWL